MGGESDERVHIAISNIWIHPKADAADVSNGTLKEQKTKAAFLAILTMIGLALEFLVEDGNHCASFPCLI